MFFDGDWREVTEEQIKKKIAKEKVIIFGASPRNSEILCVTPKENFCCIYDNNKAKWGSWIDGLEVQSPQPCQGEILITAVEDYPNLVPQFKVLGFQSVYFFMRDEIYESYYKEYINFFKDSQTEYVWSAPQGQFKYIHVFSDDKFFLPLLNILEKGFNIQEHAFLIYKLNSGNLNNKYGTWEKYNELSKTYHNVLLVEDGLIIPGIINEDVLETSIPYINEARKILFHGEWMSEKICNFFCREELHGQIKKKGIWGIWSANVGKDEETKRYIETLLKYCKVLICDRFGNIYEKLCENVDMPKHYLCDTGIHYTWILDRPPKSVKSINILLSHSCYPYNKNLETLQLLERFKDKIEVYCITSYGAADYIKEVVQEGKKIFGDRFHEVERFMPYKEYIDFLNIMDVAVYGMEIAGGFNTLQALFWLKKKIYLKKGSPADDMTRDAGYLIYDYYQIPQESIEQLFENEYAERNYEQSLDIFDKEKIIEGWRGLFELDMENLELN